MRRFGISWLLAAAFLTSCNHDVAKKTASETTQTSRGVVTVSPIGEEAEPQLGEETRPPRYLNATIVTDTLLSVPRIDGREGAWVLRLPVTMARVISDSLPRFSVHELVIGDFNGDSKADVAIDGDSDTTATFFILLSRSDIVPEPAILFEWKVSKFPRDPGTYMALAHPQEFPGGGELMSFTLRTDGVVHGDEGKGASVYWVEGGKIQQGVISD